MLITLKEAVVKKIAKKAGSLTYVEADIDGKPRSLINYDDLTGDVKVGDKVIANTVAADLKLGSGGRDFVLWNLRRRGFSHHRPPRGHIMKMRYTPWQFASLSVEEPAGPGHDELVEADSLAGLPVVVAGLHSQLYAVVAAIKAERPQAVVAYIMTDGAALPLAYSRTVRELKAAGLITKTITAGQAFGGDYEAVNIYSALLAARRVARADVVVTAMGPGIVGTGTAFGHTGIEQGQIINAVASLGGQAVAVLRLSFCDERPRHYGLSHHTVTALKKVALAPAILALPVVEPNRRQTIMAALKAAGLDELHEIREVAADDILPLLAEAGSGVTTMGRSPAEEPEFFLAAAAAGRCAAAML